MSTLKRLYHFLAVMALIHLVAFVGGVGLLGVRGHLNADRVREIAQIVRAAPDGSDEPKEVNTGAPTDILANVPPAGELSSPPDPEAEELSRRNLERVILEAEHRLILANRQMLEVQRRREAFEQQVAEQARLREAQVQDQATEGFKRDLEVISLLKPKVALESLFSRPATQAARLLRAMDPRNVKKIVEAASKDPQKMARLLAIQRLPRDEGSVTGGKLAAGTQTSAAGGVGGR